MNILLATWCEFVVSTEDTNITGQLARVRDTTHGLLATRATTSYSSGYAVFQHLVSTTLSCHKTNRRPEIQMFAVRPSLPPPPSPPRPLLATNVHVV